MSLRLRINLLYTTLLGSVLLLFGGLVYGLTNVILVNQVDQSLTTTAETVKGTEDRSFGHIRSSLDFQFSTHRESTSPGLGKRSASANLTPHRLENTPGRSKPADRRNQPGLGVRGRGSICV